MRVQSNATRTNHPHTFDHYRSIHRKPVRRQRVNECLYRWFDNDGQLLYVGITNGIGGRTKGHQRSSDWSNQAAFITLEWYGSRHEVERAEKLAIARERPRYNKVFNYNDGEPRYHAPIATWQQVSDLQKQVAFHKQLWDRQEFLDRSTLKRIEELQKWNHILLNQPTQRIFVA